MTGPRGSGSGGEDVDIDAGAGNEVDAIAGHAEHRERRAVVGVLHQRGAARALSRRGQQPFGRGARQPCPRLRRGQGEAPAGHRVEAGDRQAGRGQRSDHGRLQRHVMHQIGRQPRGRAGGSSRTMARSPNGLMLPRRQRTGWTSNPARRSRARGR